MTTATPRACIIGHPVKHSRSPLIHGHWLARYGLAGAYVHRDVMPEDLGRFIASLRENGFVGANVTVPHKEAMFSLVDEITSRARAAGACNTLFYEGERLIGDNSDGAGFVAHLRASIGRSDIAFDKAVILGAGGGARGIVAALREAGVREIVLVNRNHERAQTLAALFADGVRAMPWSEMAAALDGTDLLVNTTTLGMEGQPPLDIDLKPLPATAIVDDIVYVPLETPLLAQARTLGLLAVDGLGMLLHQAVPGFARWFGVEPEVTPELRDLIVADLERKP